MVLNDLNSIFVHLIFLTGSENLELQILKLQEFLTQLLKVRHNSEFVVSELVVRSNFRIGNLTKLQLHMNLFKDHLDQDRAISESIFFNSSSM